MRVRRVAHGVARNVAPGPALAVAVLGLAGAAAFGITPGSTLETVPTFTVSRVLPTPRLVPAHDGAAPYWREARVQRGDTIGSLLARAGVDDPAAFAFLSTDPSARPIYQLRPGRPVRIATTDASGRLASLRMLTSDGDHLVIARARDGFVATREPAASEPGVAAAAGVVESSLFAAADAAGLPDAVTLGLADAFGGDIDFYHDLRRGDRFAVVYETSRIDGEPQGAGRVLAAEFVSQGRTLRAFLWRAPDGREGYYDATGQSARRAFLRSPMEFSRITSGFTQARFHPILQTWRAHRGTDFAAPEGTPVRATADGVVAVAEPQTGYGNVLVIRHAGTYTTLYGHLSQFAPLARPGERVRQGDVVGRVGQTGWATGPHLHYEFRVADVPRDPMSIALPTAPPLDAEARAAFVARVAPLAQQLAVVQAGAFTRVAATR